MRRTRRADHQVDALGLAGVVVVQQQLGLLGQEGFAVLVVAVFVPAAVPTTARRDAVHLLGVHAHEVLAPPVTM